MTFATYKEAQDWIEAGKARMGRAFFASAEYHAAHTEIAALHKAENPKYQRPNRAKAKRVGTHVNLLAYAMQQ